MPALLPGSVLRITPMKVPRRWIRHSPPSPPGARWETAGPRRVGLEELAVQRLQRRATGLHRCVVGRLGIDQRVVRPGQLARDHQGLVGALDVGAGRAGGQLLDRDAGLPAGQVRHHVVVRLPHRHGEADLAVELGQLRADSSTSTTPASLSLASVLLQDGLRIGIQALDQFHGPGPGAGPSAAPASRVRRRRSRGPSSSTSAIASAIGPAVSRVCEIGAMPAPG